jgi:hypothetical protein
VHFSDGGATACPLSQSAGIGYIPGMDKIRVVSHGTCGGFLWFAGWLFTIGYLKLSFWPGALALLIWPYHIGVAVAALHH